MVDKSVSLNADKAFLAVIQKPREAGTRGNSGSWEQVVKSKNKPSSLDAVLFL